MIYKVKDREAITVAATAIGLTSTKLVANNTYVVLQVQAAQIRYTLDGTDPVAETTGFIGYVGDLIEVWGKDAMTDLRMIRETSTSANVEVLYMGQG